MTTPAPLWKSKWLFILAAIGAAAGLGNLWRFPYMVYDNGGAAFIVAYLICLFIVVIPMLTVETALGQMERKDIVSILGDKAGWFGRFVAWMAVISIALVTGYYCVVIAWSADFLYNSPSLAWGSDAQSFFFNNVLHLHDDPLRFGNFSMPIVIGLVFTYFAVYLSIFKGITSIGHVIKWTVPLPFILLTILFINSIFLPGSADGFRYLLIPEWGKLADIEIWKNAASQSFFSANVGMVITIIYAGYNPDKTNIALSAFLISIGNAAVSFLAGLAIFGTLGYTALAQGLPVTEVVASGPTLAFVAFPNALYTLPFARGFFAFVFFLAVITLAIDSAFALVEIVATTIRNEFRKMSARIPNEIFIGILCVIFFLWSLTFAGQNGLMILDTLDHVLVSHVFFWFIIPQIIIIGWLVPIDKLRLHINNVSRIEIGKWFNILVKFIVPVFLLVIYIPSISLDLKEPYGGYPNEFLVVWFYRPIIGIVIVSAILAFRSHATSFRIRRTAKHK